MSQTGWPLTPDRMLYRLWRYTVPGQTAGADAASSRTKVQPRILSEPSKSAPDLKETHVGKASDLWDGGQLQSRSS